MSSLAHQSVLVLGLGESGLAMARWCVRQGAEVCVVDSRISPPGLEALHRECPQVQVVLGRTEAILLDGVDRVAISPGIDPREGLPVLARQRGIPVVGEISLFLEALESLGVRESTRILAVTGTNGKTTVTTLTKVLACSVGWDAVAAGNISPSVLDVLIQRLQTGQALPQCWVLELSSFQLETVEDLGADAAVILNVTEDHLDRYAGVDEYAAVKAHVFSGQSVQVLYRDDSRVMGMADGRRRTVLFGKGLPVRANDYGLSEQEGEVCLVRGEHVVLPLSSLSLTGIHNALNVQAALALCEAGLGVQYGLLLEALRTFHGLPHRVEFVARRLDGVCYYDDSKGTNVGATLAAIEGLRCSVVLIAGGDGKGQDFSPLLPVVKQHVRAVVLIGRDAARMEQALTGCGVPIVHASDMNKAVHEADRLAQKGDAVLLSPACASLDMFRNYVHRAEMFIAAVKSLPGVC